MQGSINDKNFTFYNQIGVDPLRELSIRGGFNTFIDLELVKSYIHPTDAILELGAGYGRCLEYLINNKHQGNIVAIEQSPVLAEFLFKKFADKVKIIQDDLKTVEWKQEFDVALWMWSGIIDFSREEQIENIIKVANALRPGGRLIIDVPRIGFKTTLGDHSDDHNLVVHSPYGEIVCYIPSMEDMLEYVAKAGFASVEELHYDTVTEKHRTIFILKKPD